MNLKRWGDICLWRNIGIEWKVLLYNGCIDKKLDTLASKEACVTKTYENANTCHATEGLAL